MFHCASPNFFSVPKLRMLTLKVIVLVADCCLFLSQINERVEQLRNIGSLPFLRHFGDGF